MIGKKKKDAEQEPKKGKKKADAAEADGDAEGGKKKGKLVKLAPVVAVLALVAGWFLGILPGSGGDEEAASGSTTTTTVPGPVVVLEPITLNVPGGHYLKAGLALQLAAESERAGSPPKEAEAVEVYAPVLDAAIDVLGGRSYEELVTPAGRHAAKVVLLEQVAARFPDELEDVYFTEFVLQ